MTQPSHVPKALSRNDWINEQVSESERVCDTKRERMAGVIDRAAWSGWEGEKIPRNQSPKWNMLSQRQKERDKEIRYVDCTNPSKRENRNVYICFCVCVCVRERERSTERVGHNKNEYNVSKRTEMRLVAKELT